MVNVLVSFVLPLALTAFLNGVSVSHLVALSSQVPSLSAPGSPVPRPRGANERGEGAAPPGGATPAW
ncbi:neurotensin receptor type 2 [Prionailurus iriomotensis]